LAATIRRSSRQDEGTKQREITDQPTPFIGLYLAPLAALLFCWAVHYAIAGWTIRSWHVPGSNGYMTLATILFTVAAGVVGKVAWHFAEDRKEVWRYVLTASTTFVGLWMPFLVGIGPNRWLGTFFLICAWIVAAVWSLPRLHVLRRDPREDNSSNDGDDELIRSLGLKGFRHTGTPEVRVDPETGQPERIVVDIKHRFGATRRPLQDALPNIESALGAPEGLSRVTKAADGKSNHSHMVVILKDPLKGRIPDPGPSHPGGSPTDYAVLGQYDDGEWVHVWLCGGKNPETGDPMPPSGYAFMGMSRAGKTVTENRLLLDQFITRRGTAVLYLNKAKGGQDVMPIVAGIEAAVISDDRNVYNSALEAAKQIVTYRQKQLARYGISAYTWEKCFNDPPQYTIDGKRQPMEPMPILAVHVGEADAVLMEAGEEAVYIASKGLSTGVIAGWSLQRWAATSMPTDLRFNIGTAFCFGTGDDYSARFALSEPTINAGAHPENWKNRYPGRFYVETIGVDEARFPIPAKGIGGADDDDLYSGMRVIAEQWGPRMDRLDTGSVRATRGWWERQVRATDALRQELSPAPDGTAPPVTPPPDDPALTEQETPPMAAAAYQPPPGAPAGFVDDTVADPIDGAAELARQNTLADIEETVEIDGQRIRGDLIEPDPDDPDPDLLFRQMDAVNPRMPLPPMDPADDVEFDDGKEEALNPDQAQLAFDQAIRQALDNPQWQDPDVPGSVVVRTGQLMELYKYRTRQWYSPLLRDMADGHRVCPPGITVERLTGRSGQGWYRISRTDENGDAE
jgi:hypothetical protein